MSGTQGRLDHRVRVVQEQERAASRATNPCQVRQGGEALNSSPCSAIFMACSISSRCSWWCMGDFK